MKGKASPALLETYNTERQPVGHDLVKWSNELLRNHATVWGAIGVSSPQPQDLYCEDEISVHLRCCLAYLF